MSHLCLHICCIEKLNLPLDLREVFFSSDCVTFVDSQRTNVTLCVSLVPCQCSGGTNFVLQPLGQPLEGRNVRARRGKRKGMEITHNNSSCSYVRCCYNNKYE